MPAYRGRDVVVLFNATDISGDGRSVNFEESADSLETTAYGDTRRTKISGLEDASGSFEALDTTGAWGLVWDAVKVGLSGTLIVRPEGTGSGKRELSATAIITGRTLDLPYDDLATFSMEFEVSGAVTEIEQV